MRLPDELFVSDLSALGYPDKESAPGPRKESGKIISWKKHTG
jgi:hypothetical protein